MSNSRRLSFGRLALFVAAAVIASSALAAQKAETGTGTSDWCKWCTDCKSGTAKVPGCGKSCATACEDACYRCLTHLNGGYTPAPASGGKLLRQ